MATAQDRNIVLVLLDDVGVERVACYGLAADPPATPTFDRLTLDATDLAWSILSSVLPIMRFRHNGIPTRHTS